MIATSLRKSERGRVVKKLIAGPAFDAVNGLWLSGLYAVLAGSLAGLVCGGAVGILTGIVVSCRDVPHLNFAFLMLAVLVGALYGGFIGSIVGAIVGLPAGVLASGFSGRQGCRIGTALAAFLVGSAAIPLYWLPNLRSPAYAAKPDVWILVLTPVLLLLFTFVSYWIGNYLYNRLENSNGLFTRWWMTLYGCGIEDMPGRDRAFCTVLAMIPVLFTYGFVLLSLVSKQFVF